MEPPKPRKRGQPFWTILAIISVGAPALLLLAQCAMEAR
jgi:hypothetical protein